MTPEIHPYANLLPMLSQSGLQSMAEDIKARGQVLPIILDQHERLIDGRNRLAACDLAGVEPKFETREYANERAILDAVWSLNKERRHLNETQLALLAEEVANLKRGSNRYDAKNVDRPAGLSTSDEPVVTQEEAAKMFDASPRTIRRVRKTKKTATPKVVQAMREGKMTAGVAEEVATLPPEEQDKVAEEALKNDKATASRKYNEVKKRVADILLDNFKGAGDFREEDALAELTGAGSEPEKVKERFQHCIDRCFKEGKSYKGYILVRKKRPGYVTRYCFKPMKQGRGGKENPQLAKLTAFEELVVPLLIETEQNSAKNEASCDLASIRANLFRIRKIIQEFVDTFLDS